MLIWRLKTKMETQPIRWKKGAEQDLVDLKTHALEILEGYVTHDPNSSTTLLYSEVKFKVRVDGMLLTGTIDQVRRQVDGSHELIGDPKTLQA